MVEEAPLDPECAILDPHLHHWDIKPVPGGLQDPQCFLFDESVQTIADSGHRITHSVFVECHAMYREDGPQEMRSLGETEFANGIAAMSASGNYGPCRFAHRIVGNVDLCLGEGAATVRNRQPRTGWPIRALWKAPASLRAWGSASMSGACIRSCLN